MAKKTKEQEILPWERQQGESLKAFEAFAVYRDLGAERSVRLVAQTLDKSRSLISKWSSDNNWVKRVEDYEREQDRLQRIENEKEIRSMNIRQAKTAMVIQNKMLYALSQMNLDGLKPNEISRLIEVGMKYERIARGMDPESLRINMELLRLESQVLEPSNPEEDTSGFMEALSATASEVWTTDDADDDLEEDSGGEA